MEPLTPLGAYDVLRFAGPFLERLEQAREALASGEAHPDERQWLEAGRDRVTAANARGAEVLGAARALPELEGVRGDYIGDHQLRWVDALERLHAGITFHIGGRSPVVEALFPNLKFVPLRRASREVALAYGNDVERRLRSAYLTRMLARPEFAFAPAVIDTLKATYAGWQACLEPAVLSGEEADSARRALLEVGGKLELAMVQARFLAQAALSVVEGEAFDALGLGARPRKRSAVVWELPPPEALNEVEVNEEAGEAIEVAPVEPVAEPMAPVEAVALPEPEPEPVVVKAGARWPGGKRKSPSAEPR